MELEVIGKMKYRIPRGELKQKTHQIAGRFAFLLQKEIKRRVPGRFVNRIAVNEENGVWTIGTNDEIFAFWEKGTSPHTITPNLNNFLKFEWPNHPPELPPSMDGFHYFKKVEHPGTEGHEVIRGIVEDRNLMQRLLNEAIRSVS